MNINLGTVLFLVSVPLILSSPDALAHTNVTAEQARELIDSTNDLIVIDVREPSEYCDTKGHIPGALNYPWYSGVLEAQYGELPMDGPVLVVCGSGSRSNRAADFLDSEGFSMVYDMLGGMRVWTWETEPCVDPNSKYAGGTGEPNNPYQIARAEDLIALGETPEDYDKHFILTADIDLDPNLPGRKVFDKAVIAHFTGVFDGRNHTISHLTIEGESYLGLFGTLETGAEIRDLGVVDVNIISSDNSIGGLVGFNWGGNITNSYSTGTANGDSSVGGLVGVNWGSIITSYSIGMVSGTESVGGLVGTNGHDGGKALYAWEFGNITNSYNHGMVTGTVNVGGLVGENIAGDISMSYSVGIVIGNEDVGGLIGSSGGGIFAPTTTSSFWDVEASGLSVSDGGVGKSTDEMQTAGTFLEAGWDFVDESANGTEDIWSICEGTNYPRFVWQIAAGDFVCPDGITIDDFSFFMEHWLDDNCDLSNGYCQGTDLDQSGTVDVNDLEIFFELWSAEQK